MRLRWINIMAQRHVGHCRGLAVAPIQNLLGGCHPDPRPRDSRPLGWSPGPGGLPMRGLDGG